MPSGVWGYSIGRTLTGDDGEVSWERFGQECGNHGSVGRAGAAVAEEVEPGAVGAVLREVIPTEAVERNEKQSAVHNATQPKDTDEQSREGGEQHAASFWVRPAIANAASP